MSDLRLVVFDCDGTLVDSQHMIFAAMRRSFESLDLPVPDIEKIRRIVGLSLIQGMEVLAPELGSEAHGKLADKYKAAFRDIRASAARREPLFPGIRETLEALSRANYLLGVATGKSRVGLAATLEVHDLTDYFVTLQTADDAPGKPHPRMLERAMDEAGVRPDDTVLIGDTIFDVQMARHAGVRSIGVGWGYHPAEELKDAGAHAIAAAGDDLFDHVEFAFGQTQDLAQIPVPR